MRAQVRERLGPDDLGAFCTLPTTCDATSPPNHCAGNQAVMCPDQLVDCAPLGLVCAMAYGSAQCVTPGSCTTAFCDGTMIFDCPEGHPRPRLDCGRLGLDCRDAQCVPTASEPACGALGADLSCAGSVLSYCQVIDGTPQVRRLRTFDCAGLGLKCITEGGSAHCAPK
ncbi:MAG TPA: hypothetical protein VGQ83_40875 [Polyangia bacterium]